MKTLVIAKEVKRASVLWVNSGARLKIYVHPGTDEQILERAKTKVQEITGSVFGYFSIISRGSKC